MHKIISSAGFHVLTRGLLLSICLLLGPSLGRAEDFCAVTLKVTGSKGEPITSTWIELVDQSGRIVRREMMRGTEHKICDFGFGPHTLRVGANECLPVSISNLRVVFGFPLSLNVTLNSCGYMEQMRSVCFLYFRTVNEEHEPEPSVRFSPQWISDKPSETDGFGRWQGWFQGDRNLTFTKTGFAATAMHVQCQQNEEVDVEVVMKKDGMKKP